MRITIVATAIGLSVVGLAVAADAQAAMNKVHTDIPAQELGPALPHPRPRTQFPDRLRVEGCCPSCVRGEPSGSTRQTKRSRKS